MNSATRKADISASVDTGSSNKDLLADMAEAGTQYQDGDLPRRTGPERDAIIAAAAECFMEAGFTDTSIDDVAVRLNATKGKIYHYYRSKTDLFFDVHRYGMAINLDSVEPVATSTAPACDRLEKMCRIHLANMLDHISFQRVVMQGVEMHLSGATTPAQRQMLRLLMNERVRYEEFFRDVLVDGRSAGMFVFKQPSFASKAVLAILNNPVIWYRRRDETAKDTHEAIINQFTRFAMNCVEGVGRPSGRNMNE